MLRFPPRKILVPFDTTEVSMAAWHHARALARRFDAALEAVYVEEPLPIVGVLPPPKLTAALKAEILRHIRSKIGDSARVDVVEGDPAVTILRLARTRRPDLIVMGTNGRTGFERVWMGSVTEAVVRLSPVPVCTARSEPRPIRSVLVPVNFTSYSDWGLVYAAGVAAALKARLTLLHVTSDPLRCPNPKFRASGPLAHVPEAVRKLCRPEVEVREGEPTAGILAAARDHDLVVLVAHRKFLLNDMILGTTAERVLRHSPAPVLAVPAPKGRFSLERWAPGVVGSWVPVGG